MEKKYSDIKCEITDNITKENKPSYLENMLMCLDIHNNELAKTLGVKESTAHDIITKRKKISPTHRSKIRDFLVEKVRLFCEENKFWFEKDSEKYNDFSKVVDDLKSIKENDEMMPSYPVTHDLVMSVIEAQQALLYNLFHDTKCIKHHSENQYDCFNNICMKLGFTKKKLIDIFDMENQSKNEKKFWEGLFKKQEHVLALSIDNRNKLFLDIHEIIVKPDRVSKFDEMDIGIIIKSIRKFYNCYAEAKITPEQRKMMKNLDEEKDISFDNTEIKKLNGTYEIDFLNIAILRGKDVDQLVKLSCCDRELFLQESVGFIGSSQWDLNGNFELRLKWKTLINQLDVKTKKTLVDKLYSVPDVDYSDFVNDYDLYSELTSCQKIMIEMRGREESLSDINAKDENVKKLSVKEEECIKTQIGKIVSKIYFPYIKKGKLDKQDKNNMEYSITALIRAELSFTPFEWSLWKQWRLYSSRKRVKNFNDLIKECEVK